jgi:sugar O-acyltransferase (sialic acid O-acetyltransferase NeuD family)
MKQLVIIGARGFGREIYNIAVQSGYQVKGFLDDNIHALDGFSNYPPILGSVEEYEIQNDDVFICALGDPKQKMKYVNLILNKQGAFTNIIHPSVIIGQNTKIGTGVIICPFTYVSNDVTIGNYVTIQTHSAIGHDVVIQDFVQINALTFFGGFVDVGEGSTINPGACIIPKCTVNSNSTVGINSTVLKDVVRNTTVFGTPAKSIL